MDLVDDGHVVVPMWRHTNIQDLQETNPGKIPRCDTRVVPAGNRTRVGGAPTERLHHRATGSSASNRAFVVHNQPHKEAGAQDSESSFDKFLRTLEMFRDIGKHVPPRAPHHIPGLNKTALEGKH